MAEAAGLALGVIGVTALFSTCVEAFDIVVSARECSQEYEELSALLGLQRLRFEIWGESVGLPSGRFKNEHKIPYNTELDLPQIRPDIQRALENIRQLLRSVAAIDERYDATSISTSEEEATTLSGTHIFQKSFDRLKKRIRKGQKDKSILKVTRWALHDATQFKETIARLTSFVDGLYQVTTSLGLLQQRYEDLRIHEEVNAITDERDLELLAEATSKHSTSSIHRTVSDAASKRRSIVTGSVRDGDTDLETRSRPHSNASTYSFHTARTKPSQPDLEAVEEEDSEDEDSGQRPPKVPSHAPDSTSASLLHARSCAECEEVSLQCFVSEGFISCVNCAKSQKECSFDLGGSFLRTPETGRPTDSSLSSLRSTPQHERLLAESSARSHATPKTLSFEAGDAHHGERMKEINDDNLYYWIEHGASLVYQAYRSGSVAKRMFHELKTIRKAHVPFISATPVADDLGKILASIEGPPETPYEGGIFWILVSASQKTPPGAPIIRFHTKIYHPNIDHRTGVLCADYEQKWSPAKVPASLRGHFAESAVLWSERTSPDMWSLLALLIAICGLLASPNAKDPLVPEIAQKYVEDPEGYWEAAKMWTEKYANVSEKPDENTLRFPDDLSETVTAELSFEATLAKLEDKAQYSPSAVQQQYLRSKYDEKFSEKWTMSSTSSQNWSVITGLPDTSTFSSSSEAEGELRDPNITKPLDSLLLRDAEQLHLRQMTGECLSKIEKWRMVREVRFALEKELHRASSSANRVVVPSLGYLTNSRIRNLIMESAERLCGHGQAVSESQYFGILMRSFGGTKSGEQPSEEKHETFGPFPATVDTNLNINSPAEVDQATATPPSSPGKAISSTPSPQTEEGVSNTSFPRLPRASLFTTETSNSTDLTSMEEFTPSKVAVYTSPPTPSSRYHSQHASQDAKRNSLRAFSPRYPYSGYYATATRSNKGTSWSTPRESNKRREGSYNSYRQASHGGPDTEDGQYVDYLVNGVMYRVSSRRPTEKDLKNRALSSDSNYYEPYQYEPYQTPQYRSNSPPPRQRRSAMSKPTRPNTARPRISPKEPSLAPKATEADARRHRIPPGYSLKNWDPTEEPIMLLGSVFDANSLGKWIYDWTVYHHGPDTPIADMAGDLWLLLIQLAWKVKRAEETMPRVRNEENREMLEDFIESGERLTDKLKKLLKACEVPLLKAAKEEVTAQISKNAGIEFVEAIFGRDQLLESTEKFMASIRLWNLRFDVNCEDILRRSGSSESGGYSLQHCVRGAERECDIIMAPVSFRTAFGLEDIVEEWSKEIEAESLAKLREMMEFEPSKPSDRPKEGNEAEGAFAPIDVQEATPPISPQPLEDEWSSFYTSKKGKKKKSKPVMEDPLKPEEKQPDPEPTTDDFVWGSWGTQKKDKKRKKKDGRLGDVLKHDETPKEDKLESEVKVGKASASTGWGSWGSWSASSVPTTTLPAEDDKKENGKDANMGEIMAEIKLDSVPEGLADADWSDWWLPSKKDKKKTKKKIDSMAEELATVPENHDEMNPDAIVCT